MHYFESIQLKGITIHLIGNKGEGEKLILSKKEIVVEKNIEHILSTYFFSNFKSEKYYQFCHDSALSLNEVYTYVTAIFNNPKELHYQSTNIAKHLYNQSTHPKINGGELYVIYFQNCIVNGQTTDAVGLFKSEQKDIYLKVSTVDFDIKTDSGININKLDKGCIIYNFEKENGYTVSIVDNSSKGINGAQYWFDEFLHVREKKDDYFDTNSTLNVFKEFIVNQLPQEYEVNKADQADLLNRSIHFFKENDDFRAEEFNNEILQHTGYIKSFNRFKKQYEENTEVDLSENFSISLAAVKRQSRNYKSVIKLDANFHIYVHGNRELIEQGEDKKGKFYKIYFKQEN